MYRDYRVNAFDLTLGTLCCIKVVCHVADVVEGSRYVEDIPFQNRPVDYKAQKKMAADIKERIKKLEFPRKLRDTMESLIMPIVEDAVGWYTNCSCTKPIWTPHGTVDVPDSILDCLKNRSEFSCPHRFALASLLCREESIFEICRQMSNAESRRFRNLPHWSTFADMNFSLVLPKFWLSAYENEFGEVIDRRHLPKLAYVVGFNKVWSYSMMYGRDFALNYFIDNLSPVDIADCDIIDHGCNWPVSPAREIAPTTLCKLFSKLSALERHRNANTFSMMLLKALLDWPYQQFFLDAAVEVIRHLTANDFWWVMQKLLHRVADGYKDCDYAKLFVNFGELADKQIQGPTMSEWSIQSWYLVFKTKDVVIIEFFLNRLLIGEREAIMMNYKICSKLLQKREFQLFELLIRICGAHNEAVLFKFKVAFLKRYPAKQYVDGQPHEDNATIAHFVEIVDKILAKNGSGPAVV